MGSTHKLLEVHWDSAHDLITGRISMDLTNVFQRGVWLRTVTRAQLHEECVTDRWRRVA